MRVAIIGREGDVDLERLQRDLEAQAHACARPSSNGDVVEILQDLSPDALLVDLSDDHLSKDGLLTLVSDAHRDHYIPILGLVEQKDASRYDPSLGLDDFLVRPPKVGELLSRIQQVRWRHRAPNEQENILRQGDLVIDLERYEVWVGGREVTLTFKEFEMLRLLASNAGRVFTREALLDRVWGYDYFGGTRTVDVHVRRLRSKLEDATHMFIDTVRNVGYRFKVD